MLRVSHRSLRSSQADGGSRAAWAFARSSSGRTSPAARQAGSSVDGCRVACYGLDLAVTGGGDDERPDFACWRVHHARAASANSACTWAFGRPARRRLGMRAGDFVKSDGADSNRGTYAGSKYVARNSLCQPSLAQPGWPSWLWPRPIRKPRFDPCGDRTVNLVDERRHDGVAVVRPQLPVHLSGRTDVLSRNRRGEPVGHVLIDDLPPRGGVGLARRRQAAPSCCLDLVVGHRAHFRWRSPGTQPPSSDHDESTHARAVPLLSSGTMSSRADIARIGQAWLPARAYASHAVAGNVKVTISTPVRRARPD